jgi:5-methylcytosine-specific restriction endonuclease McrA
MVSREYRRYSNTPEEKGRLSRRACPHCGCERVNFNFGNRNALCCQPSCSAEYWSRQRPTIAEMRRLVYDEQGGKCAHCKKELHEFNATECLHIVHHYVLDHIRPIAMQGDQWARDNLQVLCIRCNRIKTARDMGAIARWKRYHRRGLDRSEDRSWLVREPGEK